MGEHEFDLSRRETFSDFTPVTIRFSDQDSMGHVNNVSFGAYIEAARTMLIQGLLDQFDHPGLDFILARVVIDYRQELHYPGTVDVGARLIRLGSKSLTSGYGVFSGDECVATSESVNVFYDMNTRSSVVPPDDVQDAVRRKIAG
ncbi:MAG: acyl-CoA thioesterase [Rhodospirillales bacterium]|nr:acyl-CoA thioesterase [Rhodospirillales bacterium]MBO6785756.1 acyl-CoA thioesterase [Rhodospirillales bacterium]